MLVIKDSVFVRILRIANKEDSDQTASSEEVGSGSVLFG